MAEAKESGQRSKAVALAYYITRFAALPERNKSDRINRKCYITPPISELSACEEYHQEAIVPDLQRGTLLVVSFKTISEHVSDGFSYKLYPLIENVLEISKEVQLIWC